MRRKEMCKERLGLCFASDEALHSMKPRGGEWLEVRAARTGELADKETEQHWTQRDRQADTCNLAWATPKNIVLELNRDQELGGQWTGSNQHSDFSLPHRRKDCCFFKN